MNAVQSAAVSPIAVLIAGLLQLALLLWIIIFPIIIIRKINRIDEKLANKQNCLMKDYIKHNLKFYEYVIDNSNVFIDAFDKDGNVVLQNKAAEEITGYKKEEVLGNGKVVELLYPDLESRRKVLSSIGTSFKQNYKNVEFTLTTKYGEKRTISWSTIKVINEKGHELGSFGFGVDITLRKKAQKREREAFLALMKVMRDSEAKIRNYEELIAHLKKENQELKNKPRQRTTFSNGVNYRKGVRSTNLIYA